MRTIKFRAWDKRANTMEEVYSVHKSGSCHVRNGNLLLQQDECELMQFTGLLDKNGKEIYEGDIVETNSEFQSDKQVIEWDGNGFWCRGRDRHWLPRQDMIEVIDNIYENPELISNQ